MSVPLSDLIPLLNVPRTPTARQLQALRNACRTFCRETERWEEIFMPFDQVNGQTSHRLVSRFSDVEILRIDKVLVEGCVQREDDWSMTRHADIYTIEGAGNEIILPQPVTFRSDDTLEIQFRTTITSEQSLLNDQGDNDYINISPVTSEIKIHQSGTELTFSATLAVDTDYHLRIVRNSTDVTVYLDGVSLGTQSIGTTDAMLMDHVAQDDDYGTYGLKPWGLRLNDYPVDIAGTTNETTTEKVLGMLNFLPAPVESGKSVQVHATLIPTITSNSVDDQLVDRFGEVIAAGARYELKRDKGSEQDPNPSYDPEGATLARQEFLEGIGEAKLEGYSRGQSGLDHVTTPYGGIF